MGYRVDYPDGSQGYAADVGTLRAWQLDGRLGSDATVLDEETGGVLSAAELSRLLALGAGPAGRAAQPARGPESAWPMVAAVLWCSAALVLHFGFQGWGFIIAGFSVLDGFRLKAAGSKWGNAVLAVSILTLAAVLISQFSRR